jgi:two-component system nitrate/nitrite response regulator NarL
MRPDSIKRSTGRVAIVSDDPLARESLASDLRQRADVAAMLGSDSGVATALEQLAADVVIWDLGPNVPPDLTGLRAAVDAGHTVVALIADEGSSADALAAGAAGVHLRNGARDRLPLMLAAAAEGLIVLDEELKARLVGSRRMALDGLPLEPLTARERQVLTLLAEGRSNRDIALALGIAERTAKFHVNAILEKLDAEGRTEAVVRAARLGLIVL